MKTLLRYFARGCLALIPLGATVYVFWALITAMDRLLGSSVPGLGFVLAVLLITLVGFLVSNVIGRKILEWFDWVMGRVPIVKLLYKSLRDLLQTFAGEKKTTGKPVRVRLDPTSETRLLGLLTRSDLSGLGLPDHVAVYLPQAYNIGGQVIAVHRDQVEPVAISATEMLTFMLSGGASGLGAPMTSAPPEVSAR
jgi:uncharacterized membrane protein